MKRYQTMTPNELENIILRYADCNSCTYCPYFEQCVKEDEIKRIGLVGLDCPKLLFNYLFEDVSDTNEYNAGYNAGWDAGRKRLIEQIEEKAGIIRKERNKR